jgi:hypothetical protein
VNGLVGSVCRSRAHPAPLDVAAMVDARRYPIQGRSSAAVRFRDEARRRFDTDGVCVLDEFLTAAAVVAVLDDITPLLGGAYASTTYSTVYLQPADHAFPLGHPRRSEQVTRVGTLAEDQLSAGSLLRRIHESAVFRQLIADIVGARTLHGYADGLTSVNVLVFGAGDELGWHFDEAEYAVTLLLRPAAVGGAFEYVPNLRSDERENYPDVQEILTGGGVPRELDHPHAGCLVFFRGRHSLHRVTAVRSGGPRIAAVLSYDSEPGVRLSEHDRDLFFGRID